MVLNIHITIPITTRDEDRAFTEAIMNAVLNEARFLGRETTQTSGLSIITGEHEVKIAVSGPKAQEVN